MSTERAENLARQPALPLEAGDGASATASENAGSAPDSEGHHPSPGAPDASSVRADRWLWAARLFKTRSKATNACQAGHVKCNGVSIKPAKNIRQGDHLEVITPGGLRILDVAELSDKRGPAKVAATLYRDLTPPPPPRQEQGFFGSRDRGTGRPSKRDRRQLDKLLNQD